MKSISLLRRQAKLENINFYKRFLMCVILLPIIIVALICINCYEDIQAIRSQYNTEISNITQKKADAIDMIILAKRKESLIQNRYLINNLEMGIKNNYSDNDELKKDLILRHDKFVNLCYNSLKTDKELYEKYVQGMSSTGSESVFICDKRGIISDIGYVPKSLQRRDWGTELDTKKNRLLAASATQMIFNQINDVIFWESDEIIPSNNHDNNATIPSNDKLLEIIKSSGLYALKDYNLLVPSYITDTGDIFGVPDVNERGIANDNNKIIVVREINMYDIIYPHTELLDKYDLLITAYNDKLSEHIAVKVSFFFIVLLVCVTAFITLFYSLSKTSFIDYKSTGEMNDSNFIR